MLGTSSLDINHPKLEYTSTASEVKKAVLHHSRKLPLTHVEADPLEIGPAMEVCQARWMPTLVITAITADANVNLSPHLHGKAADIFCDWWQSGRVSPLPFLFVLKL